MGSSSATSAAKERLSEIGRAVRQDGGPPTAQSAFLVRLARSLDVDPKALALRMEGDTVRRTKYPVIEESTDDGRVIYKSRVVVPS